MSELNYKKIGLKSGLEIHQQLDVGGKLFSRSSAFLQSGEPEFRVRRKLHRVAGEEGEIDEAVEHEAGLDKTFIYEGRRETAGLIELDESPPRKVNEKALDEVLKIILLLNCDIYGTTQIMRKTVIDGSNTSGFQRTVLIGYDGFLEMSFGKVGIESVVLEEDSARLVSKDVGDKGEVVYKLDRLGIPLVEIATAADLKSPEQIKECALKIGDILRACKVKRGIGTIRQDLNISVKGHDRVEIKGFQDPKIMIKTVELEVERQLEEIKGGESKGMVRRVLEGGKTEFLRPMPGKARMYPETDLPLLKIPRDRVNRVKKELPKLRTEIRSELKKKGVSGELVEIVMKNLDEFNFLMGVYGMDGNLVAKMICIWRKEIEKKVGQKGRLDEGVLERILEALGKGEVDKGDVKEIMSKVASGEEVEEALRIEKLGDHEIEEKIREIVKLKKGLSEKAYMGLIMKEFKGKVDARKAMEIIKRITS